MPSSCASPYGLEAYLSTSVEERNRFLAGPRLLHPAATVFSGAVGLFHRRTEHSSLAAAVFGPLCMFGLLRPSRRSLCGTTVSSLHEHSHHKLGSFGQCNKLLRPTLHRSSSNLHTKIPVSHPPSNLDQDTDLCRNPPLEDSASPHHGIRHTHPFSLRHVRWCEDRCVQQSGVRGMRRLRRSESSYTGSVGFEWSLDAF